MAELLKPIEEQVFREARTAARVTGDRPTYENRAYDAFMRHLGITDPPPATGDTGDTATGGRDDQAGEHGSAANETTLVAADRGDPHAAATDRSRPTASPARPVEAPTCTTCGSGGAPGAGRVPRGANTKIIVRIDHRALRRGRAVAGETVEVAGVGPVPVATVQELMGDAFLAAVVVKGRDVVNVAHLGRTVNAHQRTALEAMGLQCSNIACNATVGTEIDHRAPWADQPETRLDNQDPLCRADHDRKTHHGWTLEPGTGRRRFFPPDHVDHPAHATASGRTEPTRAAPTRAGPTRAAPTRVAPTRAGPGP